MEIKFNLTFDTEKIVQDCLKNIPDVEIRDAIRSFQKEKAKKCIIEKIRSEIKYHLTEWVKNTAVIKDQSYDVVSEVVEEYMNENKKTTKRKRTK